MMLGISILATELLVEQRSIACATLLQEASELLSHLWVEDVAPLDSAYGDFVEQFFVGGEFHIDANDIACCV